MSEDHTLDTPLYGHDKAEAQLAEAVSGGLLPSAYMLTGQEGIGKAALAWRLAACVLTDGLGAQEDAGGGLFGDDLPATAPTSLSFDANHPIVARMKGGSHPDFLVLRPAYDEKKKAFKSEITIDQTRKIGGFLSLTAGEGGWKVVIVDAADALNNAAANALLKWLEEPPERSLFILIAHNPGALLPTIRSRCRMLGLSAPSFDVFERCHGMAMDDTRLKQLYRLTSGSLGLAERWSATQWQDYWDGLLTLAVSEQTPVNAMTSLSTIIAKDAAFPLVNAQLLLDSLLTRVTKYQITGSMDGLADSEQEKAAITHLAAQRPLQHWLNIWDETRQMVGDATRLYLDKPQVLFTMFGKVAG